MAANGRMIFFIEWDREFVSFIKGVTLSPSLRGHIIVHIFYPQDISQSLLPVYKPWLFKHPTPKETKGSTREQLENYIIKYKFTTQDSRADGLSGEPHAYVFTRTNELSKDIIASTYNKGISLKTNLQKECTLLDFLDYKCKACMIGFKDRKELHSHDKDFHSLLCFNPECKHCKKENSFSTEEELRLHLSKQMKCQFCPGKVFCSETFLEKHLKNSHKKCSCPCGKYFGNRQTYLDHFFSYYPPPKGLSRPKHRDGGMPSANVHPNKVKRKVQIEEDNAITTMRLTTASSSSTMFSIESLPGDG
ncbi:predicted protein [Nematostella vectensis]|uniref:C2H2-type domain-containing protein n=1 Tax=Nematostella vectensis TaxID=45351 RepID=A7SSW2_NEMVE|nr:uncharacterized protein LOC5504414 [Nematostella vectensis]EDO33208.1 predicted protein [Nematostella vectensis]|eukprot:XP_001625308.1 predicted protein [Nematostella vectensis]